MFLIKIFFIVKYSCTISFAYLNLKAVSKILTNLNTPFKSDNKYVVADNILCLFVHPLFNGNRIHYHEILSESSVSNILKLVFTFRIRNACSFQIRTIFIRFESFSSTLIRKSNEFIVFLYQNYE